MTDRETIVELKEALREATEELERIGSAGLAYGLIVGREDDKLILSTDGKLLRIADDKKTKLGESVWLHPMTMQIVARGKRINLGNPATVSYVSELGLEVHGERGSSFILAPKGDPWREQLHKGDRVLVDHSGTLALALIEKAKKPAFAPIVHNVAWEDIGGHDEAKRLLREAVELPRKHAELFKRYGKKPAKGILLHGPAGCGKTLLARAVASSVGSDKGGFLAIKGPEVLDPYVGVTEQTIRAIFRQAEAFKAEHGKEAVIFVDEAESLLAQRGRAHNYMGQTVVPTFLTEMDGLEDSGAIVILATNRPDILDPAIVRDGRVDHKIEIKRPSQKEAEAIFELYLSKRPTAKGEFCKRLPEDAAEVLYITPREYTELPYSGALIEGIVNRATNYALRREMAREEPQGISQNDMFEAIMETRNQERALKQKHLQ